MYNVVNQEETYYLHDNLLGTTKKIGGHTDLVILVADMIDGRRYWDKREPISENEFNRMLVKAPFIFTRLHNVFVEQNLTGHDMTVDYTTVREEVWDEQLKRNRLVSRTEEKVVPKQYTFYTSDGSVFDIRRITDDVKKILVEGITIKRKTGRSYFIYRLNHSHTTYGVKRHFYKNEVGAKISCEEQKIKYRHRSLPYADCGLYGYEQESRRSNGWKDHKYRKQWEHNIEYKKKESASARNYWKDTELNVELSLLNDEVA